MVWSLKCEPKSIEYEFKREPYPEAKSHRDMASSKIDQESRYEERRNLPIALEFLSAQSRPLQSLRTLTPCSNATVVS
jgi:hypothetical protein